MKIDTTHLESLLTWSQKTVNFELNCDENSCSARLITQRNNDLITKHERVSPLEDKDQRSYKNGLNQPIFSLNLQSCFQVRITCEFFFARQLMSIMNLKQVFGVLLLVYTCRQAVMIRSAHGELILAFINANLIGCKKQESSANAEED